jgi:hypothetical protein
MDYAFKAILIIYCLSSCAVYSGIMCYERKKYRTASGQQGWAKLVLIALERYSVELKRLTFNFR